MVKSKGLGFDDRKWQTQEDARTLTQYQEIMSDAGRKARAMSQLKKDATLYQKKVVAAKKALGGKLK